MFQLLCKDKSMMGDWLYHCYKSHSVAPQHWIILSSIINFLQIKHIKNLLLFGALYCILNNYTKITKNDERRAS